MSTKWKVQSSPRFIEQSLNEAILDLFAQTLRSWHCALYDKNRAFAVWLNIVKHSKRQSQQFLLLLS